MYSLTITLGYYSYFFYCIATNKPQPPAEPSRRESEPAVRTADTTTRRDEGNDEGDDDGKDEKETRLTFPLRSISELFPQSGPTGYGQEAWETPWIGVGLLLTPAGGRAHQVG